MFAQLTVRGQYQGPHVFVVRIRDDAGAAIPGVRIQDNGPKVGGHSSSQPLHVQPVHVAVVLDWASAELP